MASGRYLPPERESDMSRLLRLVCLVLLIAAAPARGQAPPILDCTGPFARNADETAVAKAFGTTNVARAAIDVGEAMTEPGTVIFAGDKARRIEILWHDMATFARPSAVLLRDGAAWRVALAGQPERQIAPGMSLAEIEAINGRPFSISGFGWDLGGFAGNWHGGRLEQASGGCGLTLRFDHDPNAPAAALDKVNGDIELPSTDANVRATQPFVVEMVLRWPD